MPIPSSHSGLSAAHACPADRLASSSVASGKRRWQRDMAGFRSAFHSGGADGMAARGLDFDQQVGAADIGLQEEDRYLVADEPRDFVAYGNHVFSVQDIDLVGKLIEAEVAFRS